jgi:hypothetical protein
MLTTGTDVLFLRPQDASLVAYATNVSSLSLSLGSVPLEDFMAMLGPDGYSLRNNYHSEDERSWEQALELVPNISQPAEIYVTSDRSPLEPGLYYLRFTFPSENFLRRTLPAGGQQPAGHLQNQRHRQPGMGGRSAQQYPAAGIPVRRVR